MAYKQLKVPNLHVLGKSGYCLVYVRSVFGVASKFATAALAWAGASFKHTGNPPTDVSVPVWFKWKADGHVAVSVPGKGVYSTTAQGDKVFGNVQEVASYIGGTYLGWSEDINGVRVAQPVAGTPSTPVSKLPTVGSKIQLIPTQSRSTWKAGTATQAGTIHVTDNTFIYTIRGYDTKYPGRVLINSASAGGNGVGLALYLLNGNLVDGWKAV